MDKIEREGEKRAHASVANSGENVVDPLVNLSLPFISPAFIAGSPPPPLFSTARPTVPHRHRRRLVADHRREPFRSRHPIVTADGEEDEHHVELQRLGDALVGHEAAPASMGRSQPRGREKRGGGGEPAMNARGDEGQ
uniref:Uncharacterized protein n=1 Tax=Oryza sativa subsp. japonica TaxID=39947 RepID=Q8H4G7_ORYSJ|nr:hypothetical protein [Oryza sativa Japonica Group]